jgi:hypothetical protein
MSRLTEIIDNHENLEELFSLVKHYAVSAEFLAFSLIKQFETDNNEEVEVAEEDKQYTTELVEDLKQFYARF